MLSIDPMGSGQLSYYTGLCSEAYYTEGGERPGYYAGAGAEALGLTGPVNSAVLANLFTGRGPDGTALIQQAGAARHQPGWDATFSAPKSLSVFWLNATPEVRVAIEAALRAAAAESLRTIEEQVVYTRRGKGGLIRERAGLVVAVFQHHTSRAGDPQLHLHCLVLNLAVRSDGSTGTLASKPIFQHKMAVGALFRAALAAELSQLGIRLAQRGTSFEVEGVPESLCQEFSKRRQQIEEDLARNGLSGASAAEVAALKTRSAKVAVNPQEQQAAWRAISAKHGFSDKEAAALLHRVHPPFDTRANKQAACAEAVRQITDSQSHFFERDLIRRVAEHAITHHLTAGAVLETVRDYLQSPEVVRLTPQGGYDRFSTREMIALERRLAAMAERLADSPSRGARPDLLERVLHDYPFLSAEQQAAVRYLSGIGGRLRILQGIAGSGKTSTLAAVASALTQSGYHLIGCALAAKAARGLEEGAGIASTTLHRTLAALENPAQSDLVITSQTVVVLDEAGMVGSRQMERLLRAVSHGGGTLILTGDTRQLQPIDAGSPLSFLAGQVGQRELTHIVRQREEWARVTVKLSADGVGAAALTAFAHEGYLRVAPTRHEAIAELLADWQTAGVLTPQSHLMIAATNADVTRLNRGAQRLRQDAGLVGVTGVEFATATICTGDRVALQKNNARLGVMNGSTGTVVRCNPAGQTLTVRLDSGPVITISATTYPHITLGYAVTVHKSQGQTVPYAYALLGGALCDQETFYVEISRAREGTRLYADAVEAGERLTRLAHRVATSHQKDLAIEHLPEPLTPALSLGGMS
jgi:conjugative relaxase-like TrwC/TraI family protein